MLALALHARDLLLATGHQLFAGVASNGWVLLASGELKIASCVIKRDGEKEDLAIALLTGGGDARV